MNEFPPTHAPSPNGSVSKTKLVIGLEKRVGEISLSNGQLGANNKRLYLNCLF